MRRLPLAAASAAALIAAFAIPSAAAAPVIHTAPLVAPAKDRYAVGDSVMLGAKSNLKGKGFKIVDAVESRQAYLGPSLLRKRGVTLPKNVVVHLGTNGTFPLSVCKKIVSAAGPDRRVFLVTVHVPRSWQKPNNKVIRQCDSAFAADRVHVIDWNTAVKAHPKWLYGDHTHLRPAGAKGFASLIDYNVDQAVAAAHKRAVDAAAGAGSAGTVTL
ncbi:MAG: hypothetical protein WCP95_01455 [Actinomycetes bacterium]